MAKFKMTRVTDSGDLSWGMVQSGPMSGPGVGLQLPQNLYPSELFNAPYDANNNYVGLAAGDQLPIPRGDWLISLGSYCVLQFDDPVNAAGVWSTIASAAWDSGLIYVQSDGFSYRIANMTGCPVGGIVNAYGSGYVQATTSIAVTGGGGSTWAPIVGGQLVMTTATIVTANAGAGYGVAPIAILPAPPGPNNNANGIGGVQATGFCTIASGTVSGFTFTNPGAGYPSGTTYSVALLPNPTDPNIPTGITLATAVFSITGSGSICGVLCTNPGAPLATPNNITLTLSGAGTNGTVSAIMCQTVVSTSVIGGSTIVGAGSVAALLTSVGGYPQSAGPATPITGTITNAPVYLIAGAVSIGGAGVYGLWARPRPLQAQLAVGGTGTIAAQAGIIYDGGLFFGVPTPIVSPYGGLLTGAASTITGTSTITFSMGPRPDFVLLQPLKV
jgi:hypothetical protein